MNKKTKRPECEECGYTLGKVLDRGQDEDNESECRPLIRKGTGKLLCTKCDKKEESRDVQE